MTPAHMALSAALLALVAASATTAREDPEAPPPRKLVLYFPAEVGARCTYRGPQGTQVVHEVVKVERVADRTVVSVRRDDPPGTPAVVFRYEVSGRGLSLVESSRATGKGLYEPVRHAPPVWLLRLPARPGEKWEGVVSPWEAVSYLACPPERVKVPAGEYEAVVVEQVPRRGEAAAFAHQSRVWYAPGVGMVKMTTPLFGEFVLVQFTPGRPNP